MELQNEDIAQNHAEQPHADDADRHRKLGVAARAQGVGQGKARRPEEDAEQVEPVDHVGTHGGCLRREVEPGHDLGHQEEQRRVRDGQPCDGDAQQRDGITLRLLFLACAKALPDDRDHGKAHRVAGDVRQRRDRVCHGIGRDGRGA